MTITLPRIHWKRLTAVCLLVVLLFSGWYGYGLYRDVAALTGDSNPLQLVSAFTSATLKSTNGRTNILLAGYSADDGGHQGAELTDSIMILSIDQSSKAVTVISIPRDLYVNVPGHGYSKINAAYEEGESENFSVSGYASGGMGLLEETVEQVTGVHSNYEALINYTAFKEVVNAVGGVTVTIASSNANGLYDPNTDLKLANGTVSLNGQQALNLARARGDGKGSYGFTNGDFDRSAHQQLILQAVAAKAKTGLSLTQIASLADALGSNAKTDLQLNEIKTLYQISKQIPASSITTYTLNNVNGQNLLANYTTTSGQSALVPVGGLGNYATLQSTVASLLATSITSTTD